MKITGIDCSSKRIDLVNLGSDGGFLTSVFLSSKVKDIDDRCTDLFHLLDRVFKSAVKGEVVIIRSSKYNEFIKLVCFRHRKDYVVMSDFQWRKMVFGKGQVKQNEVLAFSFSEWGENISGNGLVRAACLALAGVYLSNERRED